MAEISGQWGDDRPPTDDELAEHDQACDEAERLVRAIDRLERLREAERRSAGPGAAGAGNGLDDRGASPDQIRAAQVALATYARTGELADLGNLSTTRAMQAGANAEGGYLVVPALSTAMTRRLHDQSPMRRLARVVSIASGHKWQEPVDMDEAGATWVGETQSRSDTDTPEIGLLDVPVNEIAAQQPITQMLLDVAYVDLGAWIEEKIADQFARTEGAAFVIGDTILKPQGFLTLPTNTDPDATRAANTLQYVASGAVGAITADSVRDLYWAMRAPHRGEATWLMASATANAIDKLKDGNGDYLWRDGMTAGSPPSLLGRPVEFDENMPAPTAGQFAVAFGDWMAGYVIVDHVGLRLLRDPYTSKPNVLFYAYKRVGGAVANTDAIKFLAIDS